MRCRSWILALVLIMFSTISFSIAYAEEEPNDTIAQAIPINIGFNKGVKEARIQSGNDIDFYFFSTEAGRTYVIETYDMAGTKELFLYNSDGSLLAKDDYGVNGSYTADARLIYRFDTAGTYYIKVGLSSWGGGQWTGTYSLRILPKHGEPGADWDPADDYEPNDELPLALALGVGRDQAQTHKIASLSYTPSRVDEDWYHFSAEAGRTYVIETYDMAGTKGLFFYNPDGSLLAKDDYGVNGKGNVGGRLVFTITLPGTYYIRVGPSSWGGDEWTGTYSVRVCERSCQQSVFVPYISR